MKKLVLLAALALASAHVAAEIVDTYVFTMRLDVPRIYDNMQSLGRREYQTQTVTGELRIVYDEDGAASPKIEVDGLVNKTHKIGGKPITYTVEVKESPSVVFLGSNRTGVFRRPAAQFSIDAYPSYAVGPDDEDNSLIVGLSGKGRTGLAREYAVVGGRRKAVGKFTAIKWLKGSVQGRLGCGCMAYGHTSPTRVAGPDGPTGRVVDAAPTFGTWRAAFKGRSRR